MSAMDKPLVSTADDFKAKYTERRNTEAETITLPSGLKVLARRPENEWWLRHFGELPNSLTGRIIGITSETTEQSVTSEERIQELMKFADWVITLVREIVVSPVIRQNPGHGEVDPNWISDEDLKFLLSYGRGEVSADGRDFGAFPGKRNSGDHAGEASRPVEMSAQ